LTLEKVEPVYLLYLYLGTLMFSDLELLKQDAV